ncbi:MAG: tRNA (guanosine(37)-N1)-methyltransferase TrmD [Corynebacterium sp.]|nr:tRNA (guanosine(37)-N1)-methyltransferase TrmD [Corynebacterium sp.]
MSQPRLRLDVISIFPEYLEPLRHALLGRAIEKEILAVGVHNLRDWATGVHQAVDDSPYGGGPGMVMLPEVWGQALDAMVTGDTAKGDLESALPHKYTSGHDEIKDLATKESAYATNKTGAASTDITAVDTRPLLIVPTPAGKPFTQADAQAWSQESHIVFACGRYEGIDQRVIDDAQRNYRVQEVSIGDYVLIGGEVAVLAIAEAVVRLIPGVLGNRQSHLEDSFSDGLLEAPAYTKPREWRGLAVPEVLLSGNHGKIAQWRREQALLRTYTVRPELLNQVELSKQDMEFLAQHTGYTQ